MFFGWHWCNQEANVRTSVGTCLDSWVQFAQFDLGIRGGEAPLHGSRLLVAAAAPGGGLADQRVGVGDAPPQALPDQDAVLACRHIEPAGVLGGVHPR